MSSFLIISWKSSLTKLQKGKVLHTAIYLQDLRFWILYSVWHSKQVNNTAVPVFRWNEESGEVGEGGSVELGPK
jgi:hypothetical protein